MHAKFAEIPSLTFQDIREKTKRYRQMNRHENSISPLKLRFAGGYYKLNSKCKHNLQIQNPHDGKSENAVILSKNKFSISNILRQMSSLSIMYTKYQNVP